MSDEMEILTKVQSIIENFSTYSSYHSLFQVHDTVSDTSHN